MSNLLQKASIVTTPTAYGVGVLNSIKPAQYLGEELVTNGSFDADIDWYKTAGWTIANGVATHTGTQSLIGQVNILTIGKTYKISFDLSNADGSNYVRLLTSQYPNGANYTSDGTITVYTTTNITPLYIYGVGNITIDNVSVKEQIDADFDFTRNSSATRVNPDYLIQDVSILSSNLVQNGNFSELGSELVTNGNFETDSNWVKGTGWTISGGKAICDGSQSSQSNFVQAGIVPINKTYKATFTVVVTSGSIVLGIGGSNAQPTVSSSGTYTFTSKATQGDSNLYFSALTNFIGSIDNVSVKQVDPNDNWVLGTGWSFETNEAIKVAGVNSEIVQIGAFTSGFATKKFIVKFSIIVNSGAIRLRAGTNNQPYLNVSGDYSYTLTPTGNDQLKFQADNTFNGSITDISVTEVQQTDIPRLDYTNGTASILLEPQSTNLIPYSEDLNQTFTNNSTSGDGSFTITPNYGISPNGTNTATRIQLSASSGSFADVAHLTSSLNGTYTYSVYVKSLSGTPTIFLLYNGSASIKKTISNDWVRYTFTFTHSGSVIPRFLVEPGGGTSTSADILAWGAQLEQQSYATSYIPTLGSAVTRAAETLNNAGNSDLINSTEGVLYAEISALADDLTNRGIAISDGSVNNRVTMFYTNVSNAIQVKVVVGGVTSLNSYIAVSNTSEYNKFALKYKQNDFSLFVNGIELIADSSGNTFANGTLTELAFDRGDGAEDFYGKCKTVAVFKEALSDTELACLTSTNNREIFLNYYYRMQYVGANTEALSCAEQTFNI